MADALNLTENEEKVENPRIKQLADKVKTTSEERDNAEAARKTAEDALATANKEKDFYASFADTSAQYPQAKEFKDDIKNKVLSGYSVEDATVSVLAKNGKLNVSTAHTESTAGGSATTTVTQRTDKSVGEMTPAERKQAFQDAVGRGDISV